VAAVVASALRGSVARVLTVVALPRYWAVATLAVAMLAVLAASAPAARPVGGASYVDTDYAFWTALRVSKSGRWFNPRRSSVENLSTWQCPGLDFHLGTSRRPVRIRPGGRFEYAWNLDR
jgi:hypothetical protein